VSNPKVSVKVGKLSRTLAETSVPTSAPKKPKPFTEKEQLAMAKALRAKRTLPVIDVDATGSDEPDEE
jgi:hypothetical protein